MLLDAEAARHTAQWHPLAASLAEVIATDTRPASQISLPGDNAAELATVIQNVTCKLGRITDLVYELADLRLVVPALANVRIQDGAVQLVFLGVEAELKFSVQLRIGQPLLELFADCIPVALHCACSRVAGVLVQGLPSKLPCLLLHVYIQIGADVTRLCQYCNAGSDYPAGIIDTAAEIQLQNGSRVTEAAIVKAAADVPLTAGRLTNICKALSLLTMAPNPSADSKQSEQELHVFCNPLFGA